MNSKMPLKKPKISYKTIRKNKTLDDFRNKKEEDSGSEEG